MELLKKSVYAYPLLIGLYPVTSLLANNITEIKIADSFRAIIISLAFSGLIYLILRFVTKNTQKAALLNTLILVLFYSYGHLYLFLDEHKVFGQNFARIRYLVPFFGVLFGVGVVIILRTKKDLFPLSQGLAVTAFVALLFPLIQIGGFSIKTHSASEQFLKPEEAERLLNLPIPAEQPDVYYIILDGYSRADTLEILGYDNTAFVQELEELGFFIADCSQANYSWTLPSITSTLNMAYLDNGEDPNRINIEEDVLYRLVERNLTRAVFENQGYTIAAFENGFDWLHWYDADHYFAPIGDEEGYLRLTVGLNGFELLFLETTLTRLVFDANLLSQRSQFNQAVLNPREIHREQVLFVLETLPDIPEIVASPKFVYVHIVSPHDPYLFGPNGEWLDVDPTDITQAYLNQITYINGRILQALKEIIQESDRPTVIILQGDHGAPLDWDAGEEEYKLGIINAYYFSGGDTRQNPYNSISPVNSFRMVFNRYFDAGLELFPDLSILGPSSPFVELPCE